MAITMTLTMPAQLTQSGFVTFFTPPAPLAPAARLPAAHRRLASLQAGLAEVLLLSRLRARSRPNAVSDGTLERAAQIIEVTSRHWFGAPATPTACGPQG